MDQRPIEPLAGIGGSAGCLQCPRCSAVLDDAQVERVCTTYLELQDAAWSARWSAAWEALREAKDAQFTLRLQVGALETTIDAASKAMKRWGGDRLKRTKIYRKLCE